MSDRYGEEPHARGDRASRRPGALGADGIGGRRRARDDRIADRRPVHADDRRGEALVTDACERARAAVAFGRADTDDTRHLATCAACGADVATLRRVATALAASRAPA